MNMTIESTNKGRARANAWSVALWTLAGVAIAGAGYLVGNPSLAGGTQAKGPIGSVAPFSVTGEVDLSHMPAIERFDHSVVNGQDAPVDSDIVGASVGAYAP